MRLCQRPISFLRPPVSSMLRGTRVSPMVFYATMATVRSRHALGARMGALIVAAGLFLGTHLGISSTPLRATLVRSTGERGYLGIYSLIAVATLGFLIYAFNRVPHTQFLWAPSTFGRSLAMAVMPF